MDVDKAATAVAALDSIPADDKQATPVLAKDGEEADKWGYGPPYYGAPVYGAPVVYGGVPNGGGYGAQQSQVSVGLGGVQVQQQQQYGH